MKCRDCRKRGNRPRLASPFPFCWSACPLVPDIFSHCTLPLDNVSLPWVVFTRAYFSCVVNSHGCLFPLPPWMRPTLATERFERKIEVVQVQWYFTSTEPILKSIRDEEPWTATSTFTQLLSSAQELDRTRLGTIMIQLYA